MKILIFDDSTRHQDMAKRQLGDHELTIFGDYQDALNALDYGKDTFDVVLTDLMVPSFPHDLTRAQEEMPVGTSIALLALAKGVKWVAIVSDANHHDHPGVRATDALCFKKMQFGDSRFQCLQEAVSLYVADTMEEVDIDYLYSDEGEQKYPKILSEDRERVVGFKGIVRGKRWDWALRKLEETE